jgi:uncharacterized protein (TIGR00661 family)
VREIVPTEKDHVLIYQTSSTFHRLLPVLGQMPHQCIIYGFGKHPASKNLVFKGTSTQEFLEDLASSRYVITNGGHNVISEALFYGKPVYSFPIHGAYEQFFNGHMLRTLGYGEYSLDPVPDPDHLRRFESRLDCYRERIAAGDYCGNEKLIARLTELIETLPSRTRRP